MLEPRCFGTGFLCHPPRITPEAPLRCATSPPIARRPSPTSSCPGSGRSRIWFVSICFYIKSLQLWFSMSVFWYFQNNRIDDMFQFREKNFQTRNFLDFLLYLFFSQWCILAMVYSYFYIKSLQCYAALFCVMVFSEYSISCLGSSGNF